MTTLVDSVEALASMLLDDIRAVGALAADVEALAGRVERARRDGESAPKLATARLRNQSLLLLGDGIRLASLASTLKEEIAAARFDRPTPGDALRLAEAERVAVDATDAALKVDAVASESLSSAVHDLAGPAPRRRLV